MSRPAAAPPLRAGRIVRLALGCAGVLAVLFVVALAIGPTALPPGEVVRALLGRGDPAAAEIVLGLRLPRTALAALTGAALASSGAVLQSVLRNPLADPFVLGVASGSAFGAVLGIALAGGAGAGVALLGLPLPAVAGAAGTLLVVYALSRSEGRVVPERMVLAGVVVSYFFSAAILLVLAFARRSETRSILFWMLGDFSSRSPREVLLAAPLLVLSVLALYPLAPGLVLLQVGEDHALSAGVRTERLKRAAFLLSAAATGAAVSASGSIGFVGLLVPHTIRLLFGSDLRLTLPATALGGAAFLVAADTLCRTVAPPAELPVGVVTAFCGAPFFLALLVRRGRA